MKKTVPYQDYLLETLKDPTEAIHYLNAALNGGDLKVFLLALHNVVKAQGGVNALAQKTKKSRTSLYKVFSEKGNPHLKNTNDILAALGLHFEIAMN